jgi:hypothetical protein
MSDATPTIHSYHEYTQHLEDALSFVRCLLHLSRKHPCLVSLDKQMSRCWNTSVNCNVPSAEDREACAKSIGAISVDQLTGPIMPAMRAMVPLLGHCQNYFKLLPLPAGATPMIPIVCAVARCHHENAPEAKYCARCGAKLVEPTRGGWQIPSGMAHGREIIDDLGVCIDDCNCLKRLSPEDELFQFIDGQVQTMARFTRQSILPSPQERATLRLERVQVAEMERHVLSMLGRATEKLHGFSQLYTSFPTN